jgi:ABC-2 type transport system ATP-binding protein
VLRERIAEALAIAGLEAYADKPRVAHFSGGMLRRLNLATGLVHRPRLLLLDEPTVGVDTQSRNVILENIRRLNREDGMTVLYTTHYMEEAEALCDRVAIMDHGQILACDKVPALIAAQSGTTIEITLSEPSPDFVAAITTQPGIESVTEMEGAALAVLAADQERGLAAVVGAAGRTGVSFETLRIVPPSLEQVFLTLTGRDLRDGKR